MMKNKKISFAERAASVWSSTGFTDVELRRYALPRITSESQQGVIALSAAALAFLALATIIAAVFELGDAYIYTYSVLSLLALHILVSASRLKEVRVLYLLAMALLVICASSMVLVAQKAGRLDMLIIASVAVLFMLVPVVPWGLREASLTIASIYLMFTVSTILTQGRFGQKDIWIFQLLMLFAALVSLLLVVRALLIRKRDLAAQYELHAAHNHMMDLSQRDPLTGSWNRRFIEANFDTILVSHRQSGQESHLALLDIDDFKKINDEFGHHRGDLVLKAVDYGFGRLGRKEEYLVRIGGDEFALVLRGANPQQRLEAILSKVSSFIREKPQGHQFLPTFSLGLLTLPPEGMKFSEAYELADALLYEAKRAGGDGIVWNQAKPASASSTPLPVCLAGG